MAFLISGGCGFIGSNAVRYFLNHTDATIINVDKLTYAGNPQSLQDLDGSPRYRFVRADICDQDHVLHLLREHRPRGILHLAAESHVDRSIDAPAAFLQSNVLGTFSLLQASRAYFEQLTP